MSGRSSSQARVQDRPLPCQALTAATSTAGRAQPDEVGPRSQMTVRESACPRRTGRYALAGRPHRIDRPVGALRLCAEVLRAQFADDAECRVVCSQLGLDLGDKPAIGELIRVCDVPRDSLPDRRLDAIVRRIDTHSNCEFSPWPNHDRSSLSSSAEHARSDVPRVSLASGSARSRRQKFGPRVRAPRTIQYPTGVNGPRRRPTGRLLARMTTRDARRTGSPDDTNRA
jgi:hypothetical protein